MDETEAETSAATAGDAVVIEDDEEELNINEVIQLDEILGSSASNKVKMLEFERQMFLDCVYNDGLVICGK